MMVLWVDESVCRWRNQVRSTEVNGWCRHDTVRGEKVVGLFRHVSGSEW